MQDKELIEALQPHNLPHMADGSFNITEAQHAAILSLLSQQEKQIDELKRWKEEAMVVMSDIPAIGKAIGVPLGQSIPDKILPAIQQLQQQQRQYSEEGELLEDMALFIEKMQNSKFYAAMTNEGKQLLYELLTRFNQPLKITTTPPHLPKFRLSPTPAIEGKGKRDRGA